MSGPIAKTIGDLTYESRDRSSLRDQAPLLKSLACARNDKARARQKFLTGKAMPVRFGFPSRRFYRFGITKVCPAANFFGSLMTSRLASRICFQRVDVL